MLRFNRALDLANRAGEPDWAGLAAECGYADQAHLTREFARVCRRHADRLAGARGVGADRAALSRR